MPNKLELTQAELQDIKYDGNIGHQVLLMNKLKEKGAPISGLFSPKFKEGYITNKEIDRRTGSIIFRWPLNADD